MSNLNPPSREHLNTASAVMQAVSGVRPAARLDYPPFIEEAVAGAAIALEKGHPQALWLTRDTRAEEWLDPTSIEGTHLHRAVARVLGGYEPGTIMEMSPKGMMEHMVADTVNTTLAMRMSLAVKDRNPVMTETMSDAQLGRVERARGDVAEAVDISHEKNGAYEKVSPSRRLALIDVFHDMADVSEAARAEIDLAARDIAGIRSQGVERAAGIRDRVADFRDEGRPLFRDAAPEAVREDANHRAEDLAASVFKGPMSGLDTGVRTHVLVRGPRDRASDDGMFHDARVAVMVDVVTDPSEMVPSPASVAMRIEGMAVMMREAEDYGYSYTRATDNDPVKARDMEMLARGEPSRMSPEAQISTFEALHRGDRVPALTAMRLHGMAVDLSSRERSADVERFQPVKAAVVQAAVAQGMSR